MYIGVDNNKQPADGSAKHETLLANQTEDKYNPRQKYSTHSNVKFKITLLVFKYTIHGIPLQFIDSPDFLLDGKMKGHTVRDKQKMQ